MSSKTILLLLVVLAVVTRIYGFDWGGGYFFHPDENNMAMSVSQLSLRNFHPHFFAYGQFPLYLAFFSLKLLGLPNTFAFSVYALRLWSAVFSLAAVYFLYRLYPRRLYLLLLIFTPGLIQLSHFGTTESLLIFVFAFNLFLAIHHPQKIFLAALVSGIGISSKISAVVFMLPVILANLKHFKNLFAYLPLTLFFSLLLSPYNLLSFTDFVSTLRYETQVATGSLPVFYTSQFIGTIPYLFQIQKIFPYIAGLPMFILAFVSLRFFNPKSVAVRIVGLSALVYFLYFGQVFVKWTRFMSPLFFLFPLGAAVVLDRLPKIPQKILLGFCLLPGLLFVSTYYTPDIRITASAWINQNLPPQSQILSEAGNVINLPVNTPQFSVANFDFYNLDSDPQLQQQLYPKVTESDYILVPSRRIFKNQSNPRFPFSNNYYRQLFSGELGFYPLKSFALQNWIFLNPENAEETWSVFDYPTIRLYARHDTS